MNKKKLPKALPRPVLRDQDWKFARLMEGLDLGGKQDLEDAKRRAQTIALYELVRESPCARAVSAEYVRASHAYPREAQERDFMAGAAMMDDPWADTERAKWLRSLELFQELERDFALAGCPPIGSLCEYIAEDVPWLLLPPEVRKLAVENASAADTREYDLGRPPAVALVQIGPLDRHLLRGPYILGREEITVRIDWNYSDGEILKGIKEHVLKRRPQKKRNVDRSFGLSGSWRTFFRCLAVFRLRSHLRRKESKNAFVEQFGEVSYEAFDDYFNEAKSLFREWPEWFPTPTTRDVSSGKSGGIYGLLW